MKGVHLLRSIKIKGFSNNDRVELECSRLILGTGGFMHQEQDQSIRLLDDFFNLGGNTLDTAHQYKGSEELLGNWLETRNNREDVHILTKGAHHDDGEPGQRVNPKSITKDLMESLDRMKTEYVDFYALHRDDPSKEVGPIIDVLNEHVRAGRIRSFGTSNWEYSRIQEANEYAFKNKLKGFSFNSPNLSLAKPNVPRWPGCVSADEDTCQWHKRNQMPLLSWSSLAGGFFSGEFSPENKDNEEMVKVYYSSENWERFRRAGELAEKKGVTLIQIALAYVLNQPFPTAAIIGPRNSNELKDSIVGEKVKLSVDEINWLNLQA